MDITNSKNYNTKAVDTNINQNSTGVKTKQSSDVTFSDELKKAGKTAETQKEAKTQDVSKSKQEKEVADKVDNKADTDLKETKETKETKKSKESAEKSDKTEDFLLTQAGTNKTANIEQNDEKYEKNDTFNEKSEKNLDIAYAGLNNMVEELSKINQKEEKTSDTVKQRLNFDDNNKEKIDLDKNNEEIDLADNNINISEPQNKINLQMGSNTNFTGDGKPFAEFVQQNNSKSELNLNVKDLQEEQAILSTMEENIAIANKNMAMAKQKTNLEQKPDFNKKSENKNIEIEKTIDIKEKPDTKTVTKTETKTIANERGIYKVSEKTNLVVDTVVSYETVVMDKSDVDFFVNLVDKGVADVKDISNAQKSTQVSKTLADLLAKAMNENKPVRIDFDNDISIIIKIDRAGKISADFLPSSQIAEAYLKENLPLLRQRFDDNNINYNELNQRQRKQDTQDNKKKGRKDE